jgi:hypothetical protein
MTSWIFSVLPFDLNLSAIQDVHTGTLPVDGMLRMSFGMVPQVVCHMLIKEIILADFVRLTTPVFTPV